MYSLARAILFKLDPETSHHVSLDWLGALERLKLLGGFASKRINNPVEVMGLTFPNPVGLAAGLDKNGDYFNALGSLGFGFVEIGTITPLAQAGNPKPRLFRLTEQQAIINRMGFNNKGVKHLVEQVKKKRRFEGILGINIGKNKLTPDENALDDYIHCLDAAYDYADYITVNISSPNTPGLRSLQFGEALNILLAGIKRRQGELAQSRDRYVPIAVKIAPDMTDEELTETANTLLAQGIDAVIATNTTISREGVEGSAFEQEAGGLSGVPVRDKSTHAIKVLSQVLAGKMPIIGVGGISSAHDAAEKIKAGASLVQLYSGFIYQGPALVREAAKGCLEAQVG
ncbi:quinone-dependent dihydroorotate dehydrogenase [Marinagarivorans algicola]|uniref:quinone-dependent dihydroorotate dehydrogenase n=1 Tax=Marinagarivorans algicola TaxID=1513270 RepID=UPI0006B88537|nr:quinone-dependent dihydroorotate dehydrogenase [Marinagarivorans algicola]